MGYEFQGGIRALEMAINPETLKRIVGLGATVAFTCYAPDDSESGRREDCPDTFPRVIHHRGGRSGLSVRIPKVVNNSAGDDVDAGEQLAAPEPRLIALHPTRVTGRLPTPAAAPEPSAERTTPHEGSGIRSRLSRVPAPLRAPHVL